MLPRSTRTVGAALAAVLVGSGTLTACSSADAGPDDRLSIVTSTDVYGDLARTIGGDDVQVTSFITDPSQDPHSFEAGARDQLAIERADVIVENGGGYDDFMDSLRDGSDSDATVLNAVSISGHVAPAGGELNEHVWYDLAAMVRLVGRLVTVLSRADPDHASRFRANGTKLADGISALQTTDEVDISRAHKGDGVAITEPVPLWMLQACGLVNRTPAEFSEAVEEGSGVPAAVLNDTLDLFSGHRVRALFYNEQTSGPETDEVLAAARKAGIPAVGMTETLPEGKTYLEWMRDNLTAVAKALR